VIEQSSRGELVALDSHLSRGYGDGHLPTIVIIGVINARDVPIVTGNSLALFLARNNTGVIPRRPQSTKIRIPSMSSKGAGMGDKGGKKDKEKNKQQQVTKQKQEEQQKQDKARPRTP
jgi:hypothetical protein